MAAPSGEYISKRSTVRSCEGECASTVCGSSQEAILEAVDGGMAVGASKRSAGSGTYYAHLVSCFGSCCVKFERQTGDA